MAAYDTKQTPEVYLLEGVDQITEANKSRAKLKSGENGVVKLSLDGSREGVKKYAGYVKMTNPNGDANEYPFSGEYVVAPPSLTVAATKMNVFYIGVENPVSISVPGIATEKIRPRITEGCTLRRDPNGSDWIVEVPRGIRNAIITAQADVGGNYEDMGSREFRVKRVPDPVAEVAGIKEGTLDRNTLLAANAIIPTMKDFEFELNFVINSFTMATIINGD